MVTPADIRNPDCTLCPLHQFAQHVCLMGVGPMPCRAMVIGEGPGTSEDINGVPFIGKAGAMLDDALSTAGLKRDDVYITNVTKCRPPDSPKLKDEAVQSAVDPCRTYLEQELAAVQPEIILAVGGYAYKSFKGGRKAITKARGEEWFDKKLNAWIIPTVHPAYVMRDPKMKPYFYSDVRAFADRLRGEEGPKHPSVQICTDMGAVQEALEHLDQHEWIAVDIESRTLDEFDTPPLMWCVGLAGTGDQAYVIPIHHPDVFWGVTLQTEEVIKEYESGAKRKTIKHWYEPGLLRDDRVAVIDLLREFLTRKKLIGHNAKFDRKWLHRMGIDVVFRYDTMLAFHLIDETKELSLETLAAVYLGQRGWGKGKVKFDPPDPLEKMGTYNGIDTALTYALFDLGGGELSRYPRRVKLFKDALMPALDVYARGEMHGVWVDQDRLSQVEAQLRSEIAHIEEKACRLAGKPEGSVNWNALQQVGEILHKELGIPSTRSTKTGRPALDLGTLKEIEGAHPIVPLLIERSKKNKLLSFLVNWRGHLDENSRLHPSFNLAGTATGRRASSDPEQSERTRRGAPNMMTVPAEADIRSIIGAPPGWKLIVADYSQIELRVAAILFGEEKMAQALRDGVDVHLMAASSLTGKPMDQITKQERDGGKVMNFGLLYLMDSEGLREYAFNNYGVVMTSEEAKEAKRVHFEETWPQLSNGHRKYTEIVQQIGGVESPLGRYRHLPNIQSTYYKERMGAIRQAVNAPVQAVPPDMILIAISRLPYDETCFYLGDVHDSAIFEVRDDKVDEWAARIRDAMENVPLAEFGWNPDMVFPVDLKIGQHWGESMKVEEHKW